MSDNGYKVYASEQYVDEKLLNQSEILPIEKLVEYGATIETDIQNNKTLRIRLHFSSSMESPNKIFVVQRDDMDCMTYLYFDSTNGDKTLKTTLMNIYNNLYLYIYKEKSSIVIVELAQNKTFTFSYDEDGNFTEFKKYEWVRDDKLISTLNTQLRLASYEPTNDTDVASKAYVDNNSGTQPDWNQNDSSAKDYIKNKTHYDTRYTEEIDNGFNFTFDGNLEGREYKGVFDGQGISYDEICLVKISDIPLSKEQLIDCTLVQYSPDGAQSYIITNDNIVERDKFIGTDDGFIFSVFEETTIMDENDEPLGVGLWTVYLVIENRYTSSISKTVIETVECGELKQLDEKFIPDTIARTDSIPQSDWNQNDETASDYIKNKPFYDEVITISETREFINQPLIDEEFAKLLYENRHTALYTIEGNSFTFSNDTDVEIGYMWIITDDNGGQNYVNIVPSVPPIDPSNIDESTVYDTIASSANTVFTVNYEKEVVHLIDEKFIPDSIAHKSDIPETAQPDWNQSNENAADYIKNRTHYVYEGKVPDEVLFDSDVEYTYYNGVARYEFPSDLELVNGTEYFVQLNNEVLLLECDTTTRLNDDNEIGIEVFLGFNCIEVKYYHFSDLHLKISTIKNGEIVVPIDDKFVPDNIARKSDIPEKPDWNQNDETASDYIKNRTHYDSRRTEEVDNSFHFTFDGNLEGREYVEIAPDEFYFVKLADTPFTKEQLIGCVAKLSIDSFYSTFDESSITDNSSHLEVYHVYSVLEEFELIPTKTLSPGIWIDYIVPRQQYIESFSKTVIETVERGELKQLDEKYIPDTIARTEYVDTAVSNLVGLAPEARNTIEELAKAIAEHEDVTTALDSAITNKANASDLTAHTENTDIHVTADDKKRWNSLPIFTELILKSSTEGSEKKFKITIDDDGNLAVTEIVDHVVLLKDFTYTENEDGTYTITDWKGTLNGEASTECIIPEHELIKVQW